MAHKRLVVMYIAHIQKTRFILEPQPYSCHRGLTILAMSDQASQTDGVIAYPSKHITFIQCWTNVEDVGPTLYKCYTNVLSLLGNERSAIVRLMLVQYRRW